MTDHDRATEIFRILESVCFDQCYCDDDHVCSYCRKVERARQILGDA